MTPKEKAEELINKMYYTQSSPTIWTQAKQCALIAVDEILIIQGAYTGNRDEFKTYLDYWQEVKQEIEKL